jgi:hypothetical protein
MIKNEAKQNRRLLKNQFKTIKNPDRTPKSWPITARHIGLNINWSEHIRICLSASGQSDPPGSDVVRIQLIRTEKLDIRTLFGPNSEQHWICHARSAVGAARERSERAGTEDIRELARVRSHVCDVARPGQATWRDLDRRRGATWTDGFKRTVRIKLNGL